MRKYRIVELENDLKEKKYRIECKDNTETTWNFLVWAFSKQEARDLVRNSKSKEFRETGDVEEL